VSDELKAEENTIIKSCEMLSVKFIVLYWQIVVCQNNSKFRPLCCAVLAHEMIHMFDFCRAKMDYKNLEHLACTEV